MAPRMIKPSFDGYDEDDIGGAYYNGPPPKPGNYQGRVKSFYLTKIESEGENKGKTRLDLLIEITAKGDGSETEFAGAGVFHSLNETEQGARFLNQFLRSITDGSEEEWKAVRKAWWRQEKQVGDTETIRGKKMVPVLRFGKWQPQEKQLTTTFVTRMGTYKFGERKGEPMAEIAYFITPKVSGGAAQAESPPPADDGDNEGFEDSTPDTNSNGLDEFSEDTTSNPGTDSGSEASTESGEDDPWA